MSHGPASLVRYRGGWDIDITPSTGLMHIDRDPAPRLHYAAWPDRVPIIAIPEPIIAIPEPIIAIPVPIISTGTDNGLKALPAWCRTLCAARHSPSPSKSATTTTAPGCSPAGRCARHWAARPGRTAPGRTGTWLPARWAVRQNRRALSANLGKPLVPSAAHGHNRVCTRFTCTANGTKLFLLRPWARPATSAPGLGAPCHICAGTGRTLPHLRRDWARPATSAPGLGAPCHNCAGTGLACPHLRRDLLGLRVCLCKARMETYCGGGTSALTCGRLDQAGRTTSATGQHSHTWVL
jgi:hypothetical protein